MHVISKTRRATKKLSTDLKSAQKTVSGPPKIESDENLLLTSVMADTQFTHKLMMSAQ